MTGELGQLALCLALMLSLAQAFGGLWGAACGDTRMMAMSGGAALGVFVFTALSFGALTTAYINSDFSVLAVFENSHTAKPLIYKISGVWGNHEGSMLLWILILSVYSAAIATFKAGGERLSAQALGIQGLIAAAFLLFVLLTSNPFVRLFPQPFEGNGLNPVLQDPGLAFHPPLLYLGYVGMSATFSYAVAALLEARNDAAWVRAARPYALAAWTALTLGIAAGSWWAYYTLGWGGFWFWDPVENASLMPWIVATALLHSMMATERSGAFKSWTLLLAIAAFSFSLIGTFLVRSGIITSVHAFASDPARGTFILLILFFSVAVPLTLFAWRVPKLAAGAAFEVVSRETGILINNLVLSVSAIAVLIGTLFPLLNRSISVGAPFYNTVILTFAAILAVVIPFGPIMNWRRGDLFAALHTLRFAGAAAAFGVAVVIAVISPGSARGLLAVGLGIWLIVGAGSDLVRRAGGIGKIGLLPMGAIAVAFAHGGLGVTALGVAGTSVWKSELIATLKPGESAPLGPYILRLDGTTPVEGPNYLADRVAITLMKNGAVVTVVHPEKRNFVNQQMLTTNASIRSNGFEDLYITLGDKRDDGAWAVSAYLNPLAPFIWLGGVFAALGGALALTARIRRSFASRSSVPAGVKGALP